jgi:hypothetical protein
MNKFTGKHKPRSSSSTSSNFFPNIFNFNKTQSTRYEDTTSQPFGSRSMKRLRKQSKSDENETAQPPHLVRFYDPEVKAKDSRGRTLDDILNFNDYKLEQCHDYIQWLFPLPEGSPFNIDVPVITKDVFDEFRSRPELRAQVRRAWERIMYFYGFILPEKLPVSEEVGGSLTSEDAETRPATAPRPEGQPNNEPSKKENDPATKAEEGVSDPQKQNVQETSAGERSHINDQSSISTKSNALQALYSQSTADAEPSSSKAKEEASEQPAHTNTARPTSSQTSSGKHKSMIDDHFPDLSLTSTHTPSLPATLYLVHHPDWQQNFKNWVLPFDHNHLRITRILRSCRVLGLQAECEAFYDVLKDVYHTTSRITEGTFRFWRRAVKGPLGMTPMGDEVPWLMQWDEQQKEMLRILKEREMKRKREEEEEEKKKAVSDDVDDDASGANEEGLGAMIQQDKVADGVDTEPV